jgi:hypothetical protein
MSRIISKLFSRVIKAEESEISPFSRNDFDLSSVLKLIEHSLSKCKDINDAGSGVFHELPSFDTSNMAPLITLIDTFVHQMLRAKYQQGKLNDFLNTLDISGLGRGSLTGKILDDGCQKLGIGPIYDPQTRPNTKSYDVDYLSELIFTIGGAQDGQERFDAMTDLRDYLDAHKDIDIETHLSGVSSPFRKYILDQLKSPFRPLLTPSESSFLSGIESSGSGVHTSSHSLISDWSQGNMTMSQKLRYLKNKISAAEATASTVKSDTVQSPLPTLTNEPFDHSPESPGQSSSLRQRLAAATERANLRSPEPINDTIRPSSAIGNAAALRARLESVKRMSRD